MLVSAVHVPKENLLRLSNKTCSLSTLDNQLADQPCSWDVNKPVQLDVDVFFYKVNKINEAILSRPPFELHARAMQDKKHSISNKILLPNFYDFIHSAIRLDYVPVPAAVLSSHY